jgi:SSS family solute:Na+ symporter
VSGTMVLGLGPVFLCWRWHRPAPLAFHLSFLTGLSLGIWSLVAPWPAVLSIGAGKYGPLLGQNAYGLLACFGSYSIGAAIESLRARTAVERAPAFFEPIT